ncbi:MAG TPA: bifunctional glutamate N-acetyltransferase/amino-acid acetyltransferase ArgJ [Acidimicrobiales bacterium]|nr:bifunctional glutamate N-acetyltransferase/amino-acid acetyltransferase ArgJ [Acidimicrobiales bacterium]
MSVTAARGFVAGGVWSGIKPSGVADLSLVATEDRRPVPAAAVFTTNLAAAAPVQVSRAHLAATSGRAAAVILNSGNANAATGADGRATAQGACDLVARQLGCRAEEVLVCSTGLIGIPLALDPFTGAVPTLAASLAATAEGGELAADAIMTTDTIRKESVAIAGGVTVGGMAKGAAMLAPNMATMLGVLTTDARVDAPMLQRLLASAMDHSFHRITVDGCTSTNDTVIILASGRAEHAIDAAALGELITRVCADLAEQMVCDAEGATKLVRVTVKGAASDDDAAKAARRIADSNLCKCSWYGQDPYWGRVVSEAASAGAAFDIDKVSVAYGDVVVARGGVAVPHDGAAVRAHMEQPRIDVTVDLGLGDGSWWLLTNDLTHAYVDENMGTS